MTPRKHCKYHAFEALYLSPGAPEEAPGTPSSAKSVLSCRQDAYFQGTSKTIEVENGLTVMEGAIQKEIPGIDADCGGSMACATCHVYVDDKWIDKIPKAEDAEIDMIDMAFEPKKNSRLSCQIIVSEELDGLEVTTPAKQT